MANLDAVLAIGHRGAAGHAPENTLRAIAEGIRLGADMLEIDVQRTRDGHLVVHHDKRVERTTNGSGAICEMTLSEVRGLDAGGGERVPLLEEVLTKARGHAGLMIELIVTDIANQVVAAVKAASFDQTVIYASFLHAELLAVRSAARDASTLALLEGIPVSATTFAEEAQATHVGIARESLTPAFVRALKAGGFKVFVYTVNDAHEIAALRALGVDGLISDFPDRLK